MQDPPAPGRREFHSTRWSLVLAAGAPDESRAREALEELCRAYWYPLYAFVRYRGHSPEEAEDLTQSFFTRIIEKRGLATADPEKGRFRSYLLGAMKNFLANEWHRARALKRGGGRTLLEWDALAPEARFSLEPAQPSDPDAGFDRQWARETIDRALSKLREELDTRGKGEQFDALSGCLTGEEPNRKETAARLGMTENAVKVAVHRLRHRYREILRAGVAETLSDPADVDAEMRHLVEALRAE
jgi:RNA polymerase sigma-70 factor (ECF subfamily)